MPRVPLIVLGAGPAGLGAALKLASRGAFDVTVVEREAVVGGNAGSFEIDGLRVDYGSHRLHPACPPAILDDIRAMLGDDLLDRPRHGRIRLHGRWLHFPLAPANLALHVPPSFLFGIARDAVLKPRGDRTADTFATVLERSLGRTICREFYFPYAMKIWGVPPSELDVEQARRRVSASSLGKMARKALSAVPGLKKKGSGRFYYPRHGYGQISEAYRAAAERAGARILLRTPVARLETEGDRVTTVVAAGSPAEVPLAARHVLSTIPLPALVRTVRPPAPPEVLSAAGFLRYRAMILVYLALGTDRFTEYDAHYFPGPDIAITRLSEPKNYGLASHPGRTVLCAELPCSTEDPVWRMSDPDLGTLVADALARADLPIAVPLRQVLTRRLSHAYPIYVRGFHEHFDRLDEWVGRFDGLVTLGRQGLFAHDNTHHTLAMAYAACDCLDDTGTLDRARWAAHRQAFQDHVVED